MPKPTKSDLQSTLDRAQEQTIVAELDLASAQCLLLAALLEPLSKALRSQIEKHLGHQSRVHRPSQLGDSL